MKIKVLIVYNRVWSYRERVFEYLNDEFDLTVGYSDASYLGKEYSFKTIYLPVRKIGPFEMHYDNLHKICSNYDVVIGISNIRWISLMALSFRKRRYKIGYWGIGVTASYENKFDSKSTWDRIRFFIGKRCDFLIFYSSYPIERYIAGGVKSAKLFVANNTTEVGNCFGDADRKKNFLFIGTLYKQKGFEELLLAYARLFKRYPNSPDLLIIGDGPEKDLLLNLISVNGLHGKVKLLGKMYDKQQISDVFDTALACISPNQAGLSVLNAMGNKTIFVTRKNAITGGEIFNIENYENGIVIPEEESLESTLEWIINNTDKVAEMNSNAFEYYSLNRTPYQMADSIKNAIKFCITS